MAFIQPLRPVDQFMAAPGSSVRQVEASSQGLNFGQLVQEFIDTANQAELADQQNSIALASGNIDDLHTSMIAANKAELSLRFVLQVRNKAVEAYQEVMRMQV